MDRMVIGLEQLIENDMPFFSNEREERLDNLRDVLTNPNVAVSEQFAQVLNAYQIENDYGRTMNAYTTRSMSGAPSAWSRCFRLAGWLCSTRRRTARRTGFYNKRDRRWEELDDSFQAAVRTGLRMAKKQAGQNLLPVPILVEG